ncbi:MAG TPA: CoA transferase [Myxococcales bacterium]|nr:CoA transferase [Myxococcales bacterium]
MTVLQTPPLKGLRVLDLSRLLPGPFLTLLLADQGADVTKIEAPSGGDWVRWIPPLCGPISIQFSALNRGKKSIALNLKSPDGVEILKRLVKDADVLVESFRPGVMDRLGVGYDALSKLNPALVYVAVTGYGQDGAYKDRAGHDLNYSSLAATVGLTGKLGGDPIMAGFQLADISGALYGVIGALSAVYARQNDGQGRFVDVSLAESALSFNVLTLASEFNGTDPVVRGGDRLGGGAACYQLYECSDGGWFSVGALEPKFWHLFCDVVEKPEWKIRHMGDDEALKKDIAALFKTRTRDEWEAIFSRVDACCEPVLNLNELDAHPLHTSRKNFFDLKQSPDHPPLRPARTPLLAPEHTQNVSPAPDLGEHTRQLLAQAGYSTEQIDTFIKSGTASGSSN